MKPPKLQVWPVDFVFSKVLWQSEILSVTDDDDDDDDVGDDGHDHGDGDGNSDDEDR